MVQTLFETVKATMAQNTNKIPLKDGLDVSPTNIGADMTLLLAK